RRAEIAAEAGAAAIAVLEGGMAETVIGGTTLAILQHVVGFVDFLEFMDAIVVTRIAVGVPLHRQLAKRGLDLAAAARPGDAKNLVIVAFRHARFHLGCKRKTDP